MYAFVHIAKTAGTTLTSILRRSFGLRHFDDRILNRPMTGRDLRRLKRVMPQVRSLAGHGIRPHLDLHEVEPKLKYFTFLREPIERAVSCFQFVAATHPSYCRQPYTESNLQAWFFEHIERDNNCQTWHLAGRDDADLAIQILDQRVGFVGLVSHFEESLQMLQAWMQDQRLDIRYQSLNVTAQRSGATRDQARRLQQLREFGQVAKQDPRFLDFVRAHNASDIELYRYAEQVSYPAEVKRLMPQINKEIRLVGNSFFPMEAQLKLLPSKLHRNLVLKPLRKWLFEAA